MIDARIHAIERELTDTRRECRIGKNRTDDKIDKIVWGILATVLSSVATLVTVIVELMTKGPK